MNENKRVRYSRLENRRPKNTLVTIRDGNNVYFGIARCNVKLDTFHKNIGTYIAEQRAKRALDTTERDSEEHYSSHNNLRLHESGLRGYTTLEKVKEVVNYFRNVDEYCLNLEPRTKNVEV